MELYLGYSNLTSIYTLIDSRAEKELMVFISKRIKPVEYIRNLGACVKKVSFNSISIAYVNIKTH